MLWWSCKYGLVLAVGVLTACSTHQDSPALAQCAASGCVPKASTTEGSAGSGNLLDSGSSTLGVSLQVSVAEFLPHTTVGPAAWTAGNVIGLAGDFSVSVPSVTGLVLTDPPGPSPFSFSGVLINDQSWVSVTPLANPANYYPGIRNIPNTGPASVTVPLLRKRDLDFISTLLSTQPLVYDATRAQVVVKIVDVDGNGIAGARVSIPDAQGIAYSDVGLWIDSSANPFTDPSGLVFAINVPRNVPASTLPGSFVTVTAVGPNALGTSVTVSGSVPILAGSVSYGTVLIQ